MAARKPTPPTDAAPELVRIKMRLPSKLGKRKAFTSAGEIPHGGIVDLPADEARIFLKREEAFPFDGPLTGDQEEDDGGEAETV